MHRAPRFAPMVEKDGVSRSGDSAQVKNSPSLRFLYKMRFKVTLSNRKPIIFQSLSIRIKHTTRLFSRKAPFEGDPSSGDAPKASALDSGSPGEPVGPGGCTREQTTSSRRRARRHGAVLPAAVPAGHPRPRSSHCPESVPRFAHPLHRLPNHVANSCFKMRFHL